MAGLKNKGIKMLSGVSYLKIDDQGLHIEVNNEKQCLKVDHVILCAGQNSMNALFREIQSANKQVHIIGGADIAAELDAKRAIRQGADLAAVI